LSKYCQTLEIRAAILMKLPMQELASSLKQFDIVQRVTVSKPVMASTSWWRVSAGCVQLKWPA
jgi:hypothetical protein